MGLKKPHDGYDMPPPLHQPVVLRRSPRLLVPLALQLESRWSFQSKHASAPRNGRYSVQPEENKNAAPATPLPGSRSGAATEEQLNKPPRTIDNVGSGAGNDDDALPRRSCVAVLVS